MKKKSSFVLLMATVIILGLVLAPLSGLAAQKTYKWRMVNLYPRGISFGPLYQEFCDIVKKMSGGRLVIEALYDGEGVGATEVWSAVKSGLVEMGAPYIALHAGEFPAGVVTLGLPGGPTDFMDIRALHHEGGWMKILNEAANKQDIMFLSEYLQPGTYVFTKKPINSIDDFKKLKIRAPGAYGKFFRKLGASPAVIAFGEVYTSLATGVIDGVDGCNLIDHRDGKFYEVAKYMYPLPITGAQSGNLIVNIKAYKSLPEDLKAILWYASMYHGTLQSMKSLVWEKEALKEMMAKGLKMSPPPSAEDKAKWIAAGQAIWPEYENQNATSKKLIETQRAFMKKLGK